MCNSIKSVTLQTAILLQVKEFSEAGQTFSIHDITRSIRDKCNTGKLEIPEVEDLSGADTWRFSIDHKKLRTLFNEMRDQGVFDGDFSIQSSFNGMYFEYSASSVASTFTSTPPSQATPAPTLSAATPPKYPMPPKTSTDVIKQRVDDYLENCKNRNFRPSIKQIQSAIKRGPCSTGMSGQEILDIVVKDLGYGVVNGGTMKTMQVVV